MRVTQSSSSGSEIARVSGIQHRTRLPHYRVISGSRHSGAKLIPTSVSNTRNDPAHTLPERLLDPVGVWNGVDWDYGLGHGHSADLSVVITEAGENRG